MLEGTAVVRVVDVDPPPSSASGSTEAAKATAAAAVAAGVVEAKESKEEQAHTLDPCCQAARVKVIAARETGLAVLEESMRALTLGKK